MEQKLENIRKAATIQIEAAQNTNDLENIKNEYLSRKGEFNPVREER